MEKIENNRFYRIHMAWSRFRNGLVLFSVRNFMTRFGLDIDPYYWEREGLAQSDEPRIRGDASAFSVVTLDATDIRILDNIMGMDVAQLKKNIENGQFCIGLQHGKDIAALMFAETKDVVYKNRAFKLGPGDAYLLNMYTFEAYRGKNLAPYLRYHSYKELEKRGIDNIYSITAYFNKSSLKFKQKLKVQHLHLFLYIGLFKKFHWNYKLKDFERQKN